MIALLLSWTVQATVIGTLGLALARVARRSSPRFRHGFLSISLLAFLAPPVLSLPGVPALLSSAAALVEPLAPDARLTLPVADSLARFLSLGWALGFVSVMGLIGLQSLFLTRLLHGARPIEGGELGELFRETAHELGLSRPPRLLESSSVRSPCAAGLLSPAVLLPPGLADRLSTDAMAQLLAHELAHVRQRDPWLNWLRALACALWWPHPLVWVIARRSRSLREESCDDVVLTELGAAAGDYARTIVHLVAAARQPSGSLLASSVHSGSASDLESRLKRLGEPRARRSKSLSRRQTVALAGFALLALNGAVAQGPRIMPPTVSETGVRTVFVHLSGHTGSPPARHEPRLGSIAQQHH